MKNYIQNSKPPSEVDGVYAKIPDVSSLEEYDNYLTKNPFSNSKNFTTQLSLDFVRFFIPPEKYSRNDINLIFESLGASSYLINRCKGRINSTVNNKRFKLYLAKIFKDNYYVGSLVTVYQPNREILDYIAELVTHDYLISKVEFTADLRTDNSNYLVHLFGIIKNTMCLKWAGKNFTHDYNTLYMNNVRKTRGIGSRAYIKDREGTLSARIEIICKRRFFKDNKIKTLNDLYTITGDQVFKRLAFRQIKTQTIGRKWSKVARDNFPGKKCGINVSDLAGLFFDALVCSTLDKGVSGINKNLTCILSKGVYLEQHPFHDAFFNTVYGQEFI